MIYIRKVETINKKTFLKSHSNIKKIKGEKKTEGYSIRISGGVFNVKKIFTIDVASGDYITPEPIDYLYKSYLFEENTIKLKAYNLETIFSEKLESIISRGLNNTRMKDYYDIYLILNKGTINYKTLGDVIINTFENRNTKYSKKTIMNTLSTIIESESINQLYFNFIERSKYAVDIKLNVIIEIIEDVLKKVLWTDDFNLEIKKLIFVRHGEDSPDKLGGWSDNKLTHLGKKQVKELSINLRKIINDEFNFISSDSLRAKETANIIGNELSVSIVYNKQFRETNNGDLKNMSKNDLLKEYKEFVFSKLEMNKSYPNGESPKDFYNRIKKRFYRT